MFSVIIPVKKNPKNEFQIELQGCGSESLLSIKINSLKKLAQVDEVIVATNLGEAATIAVNNGAKVLWREGVNEDDFSNLVDQVVEVVKSEQIIWAFATTPLLSEKLLKKFIDKYLSLDFDVYDSLITCSEFKRYIMDDNGPINFRTGHFHKDSSLLPAFYTLINGFFIMSKEQNREFSYPWGRVPYKEILSPEIAFEIKNKNDFDVFKRNNCSDVRNL